VVEDVHPIGTSARPFQGVAPSPRYRVFGSYRFLLAVSVVVSHTWDLTYTDTKAHIWPRIGIGNVAVMAFFILSGFVITEALATFYRVHPWSFLANRVARLGPPYWAALVLSLALHTLIFSSGILKLPDYQTLPQGMFDPVNIAANVFAIFPRPRLFAIDPVQGFYGFVRYYWAVYIEFVFYIGAFAVTLAICIFARRSRAVARIFVVAGVAGALILHGIHEYGRQVHWELPFAPYFVVGVCLYGWVAQRDRLAIAGGVAAYAFVFLHFARYAQGRLPSTSPWVTGLSEPHVVIALGMLLAMPIIILLLARLEGKLRLRRWDRRLGDLSYPIYLNHYAVVITFFSLVPDRSAVWQLAAIAVTILVSWMLVLAVERPMLPLRNRLRGHALR
jgi:peptidoglycan/LPS O-acetylase OafA/YrhL